MQSLLQRCNLVILCRRSPLLSSSEGDDMLVSNTDDFRWVRPLYTSWKYVGFWVVVVCACSLRILVSAFVGLLSIPSWVNCVFFCQCCIWYRRLLLVFRGLWWGRWLQFFQREWWFWFFWRDSRSDLKNPNHFNFRLFFEIFVWKFLEKRWMIIWADLIPMFYMSLLIIMLKTATRGIVYRAAPKL